MSSGITRRAFAFALPLGLAAQNKPGSPKKPKLLPEAGEFKRISDPVTENTIVRLTAATSSSVLPSARNRFLSTRERTLLFSSDRSGSFAPFQLDLRTGVVKKLADAVKLNVRSLCFDKPEKMVRYLDGETLFEVALNRGAPRRLGEGYSAFGMTADGSLLSIAGGKLVRKEGSEWRTLAEDAHDLWPQPNSAGCLFARASGPDGCELYYVPSNGSGQPQRLASGPVRQPYWDADGESILFLRDVATPSGVTVAEIHGVSIHGGGEYVISPTSQFACFAPNSDASVFVGASRSKAQPNVVLLLRSPHREMTLCEHHASHPGEVSPAFSPDNRRVYFESDHEGRSAVYSVNVELLVEPPA